MHTVVLRVLTFRLWETPGCVHQSPPLFFLTHTLHLPPNLAVRCDHVTNFWPLKCNEK